jgi:hypothetical protein
MQPIYWKLGITVVVGTIAGLVGGQATTAGLVQPALAVRHLDLDSGKEGGGPERGGEARTVDAEQARIASACEDCSDYDLGFRFAASRHLTTTSECMDYSWSYQRGCLAYLREG